MGKSDPFLAMAVFYLMCPILICQLELLAFAALKPGVGAHGSRIVDQSRVHFLCCSCPNVPGHRVFAMQYDLSMVSLNYCQFTLPFLNAIYFIQY